jgi:hypothetical protein
MCIKWLKEHIFKAQPTLDDAPFPKERDTDPLYDSPDSLRRAFYDLYNVSDPAWWDANVGLRFDPNSTFPSSSINDVVTLDPAFARPCIIAHEFCHSIYSKLTNEQRQRFGNLLPEVVASDHLIELAIKDYGNSSNWAIVPVPEAHGQIYRFFGQSMPVVLHEFYPHLLS